MFHVEHFSILARRLVPVCGRQSPSCERYLPTFVRFLPRIESRLEKPYAHSDR
jgi:hypothetical protein